MGTLDVVFVKPPYGNEETKTFTQRPLGLDFVRRMPIVIRAVNGEAAALGVKRGWVIKAISGMSIEQLNFEAALKLFKQVSLVLKVEIVIRECPQNEASTASLGSKVGALEPGEVPDYLKKFGYDARSASTWGESSSWPELLLGVIDGHRELDGIPVAHTWYNLKGTFTPPTVPGQQDSQSTRWLVKRRLAHLRALLHDPVKSELANDYDEWFSETHFAHHTGPPGTTSRLEAWLGTLAKFINSGKASPNLVALTLRFLEAPDLDEVLAAQGTPSSRSGASDAPSAGGGSPFQLRFGDLGPGTPQSSQADSQMSRHTGSPQAPQAEPPAEQPTAERPQTWKEWWNS